MQAALGGKRLLNSLLRRARQAVSGSRPPDAPPGEAEFREEFLAFERLSAAAGRRFRLSWEDRYPCLGDKTAATAFDRHYDYRPADLRLSDLTSEAADLLSLPFAAGSVASPSCMHVVEHVGLGRYGDPLDPEGDLKAIGELKRVLAPGGTLLFVVPVGRPKVAFNAHRVYVDDQIVGYFSELELVEFALVPDDARDGGLVRGAAREAAVAQEYGCGCFWFRKGA